MTKLRLWPSEEGDILRQVSPITHVTKESPPTFLIHGDKDVVVPLQPSEVIVAKL